MVEELAEPPVADDRHPVHGGKFNAILVVRASSWVKSPGMGLVRFGVSLDEELLKRFDSEVVRRGYSSRSEAIRDLIRERLVQREWEEGEEVVGVITLVYDHRVREIEARLTDIQHGYHGMILSTMHIHLDHRNCLEIVAVRGKGSEVEDLAAKLIGLRGVRHGKLVATTTGRRI